MHLSRFVLTATLLVLARAGDLYSTSLWILQPGGLADETNPLTRLLGVGWQGLILANILVTLVILLLFGHACFRHRPVLPDTARPRTMQDYASLLYFGESGQLIRLLYRWPSNKPAMIAHSGEVLIHTVIVASLLATVHNLAQYHQYTWYATFREVVGRPLYVIYGCIFLTMMLSFLLLLRREWSRWKKATFVHT